MKIRYSLLVLLCLLFAKIALAQPQIPTGRPIRVTEILSLAQSVGGFLIVLGGILAVIVIIITGFMYMLSGGDSQRVTAAKNMFKAGIIGALIIFSAGLIVNTISGFATNPLGFFGGSSGTATYCSGGVRSGQTCASNNDCPNDLPGTCGGAGQPLCSFSICL